MQKIDERAVEKARKAFRAERGHTPYKDEMRVAIEAYLESAHPPQDAASPNALRFYKWGQYRGLNPGLEGDTGGFSPEEYWDGALDVVEGTPQDGAQPVADEFPDTIEKWQQVLDDAIAYRKLKRTSFSDTALIDRLAEALEKIKQIEAPEYPGEPSIVRDIADEALAQYRASRGEAS